MAISRAHTWAAGEVLLASDLNSEFNNIINNGADLVSPFTKAISMGGFALNFDAANTISMVAGTSSVTLSGGTFREPVEDSITAHAGGTQAAAFALSVAKKFHRISVCATAGDSVALPTSTAGQAHFIRNDGAAAAQVFGTTPDTINGVATATGVALPAGTGAWYVCTTSGNWTTTLVSLQGINSLSSVSGTNTVTATAAFPPAAYVVGQVYEGIAANTNTGATTLNISSLGAGAVQIAGAALTGGELLQNAPFRVFVSATTPVFQLISNGQVAPFLDTNALIKGSADGTKKVRFEVDGLTTATTRVLTVADGDFTIADGFTTGDVKLTLKTVADTGWVLMDDKTIGDGSSGATGRANADTSALFTLLWDNTADADCAVSTGRGASAAADFAAHKTIALPKALGRSLAVYGAGSGLTSRALAHIVGEESHTLTAAELPSGTPTATTAQQGQSGANGLTFVSAAAGAGTAANVMQPTVFLNVMIKL